MVDANHSQTRTSIRSSSVGRGARWSRALLGVVVAACAVAGPVSAAHAAPGGDVTIEETAFDVPGGQAGSGVATCPANRRVVGGGIGTTADIVDSGVQVSGPVDETTVTGSTVDGDVARSWYANVRNFGNARTYKVFALCSAISDAVIEETTMTGVAASEIREGVATCPAGRRVVGGGIGTTATDVGSEVQVSGPVDETGNTADTADGDIATGWLTKVTNVSNVGVARTYRVFALCSATSDAVIEETTIADAAGGQVRADVAKCPAGRRVTGGGIGTTAATAAGAVQVSGPLDETGQTVKTADGDTARYWYSNVYNAATARTFKVFALCATDDLGGAAGGGTAGGGTAGGGTGGGIGTGGGVGGGAVSGQTAPVVSALAVTPLNVRPTSSGPSITTSGGSVARYTLSAPALVRFAVLAARTGRRVGGSCVSPKRSNRRKRSCTRYVTLPGIFTHQGQAGPNRFNFSGRVAGRRLAVGNYRLTATAGSTPPALAPFRIVRARR